MIILAYDAVISHRLKGVTRNIQLKSRSKNSIGIKKAIERNQFVYFLFQSLDRNNGVGNADTDMLMVGWNGNVQWVPEATYS